MHPKELDTKYDTEAKDKYKSELNLQWKTIWTLSYAKSYFATSLTSTKINPRQTTHHFSLATNYYLNICPKEMQRISFSSCGFWNLSLFIRHKAFMWGCNVTYPTLSYPFENTTDHWKKDWIPIINGLDGFHTFNNEFYAHDISAKDFLHFWSKVLNG